MKIEADVFSGRENPSWPLTAPDSQSICKRLARLQAVSDSDWAPPAPLGYRGIVLRPGHYLPDVSLIRVFRGVVMVESEEGNSYFLDPDLERSLLEMGRDTLEAALYEMLKGRIQAG